MSEPLEQFNPAHYAGVRRPLLEAETLPAWCYTSKAFYDREVERIFMRVWNFVGRADAIPRAGDYMAFDFAGVPVVLIRGKDREVRAFVNVCRHRGTKLLDGKGNATAIKCPYHSWTYAIDGTLEIAPQMEETVGFDKTAYGLKPIRLETWGGFLFIAFDDRVDGLASHLGDLPRVLESYGLDDLVCTRRKTYDLACNWKVYVENAMESYHVPTVHGGTLQKQWRDINPPIDAHGQYCGLYTRHQGSRALLAGETGFPYIASLQGDAAAGTYYPLIYPSTMFGCTYDCVWWLELHPMGPARTKLIVGSCFPRATVARPDFDDVVARYYRRWDLSIPEDNVISERQQEGLASPFSPHGRFSYMEPLVHTIDNWVLDRVLDQ
ncbi:MAG: aromatic ring-hydroxylating dioxygenase subunit alpha [Alphaproteobacteria bacterium]|nr:aromatic ring-hydroxylating dioxygenase subunit alpha [Alphaproteobacteria bacterium]